MKKKKFGRLTKPKNDGGLGIKNFGMMNKALITKQYWRICNNPNLLVAKTLKSKYCPNGYLQSYKPKQNASWIWRNIMYQHNPKLVQGTWSVGRGFNIPINHPAWSKFTHNALASIQTQISTVVDLIDQQNARWKTHLILQLYDKRDSEQILNIHIPMIEANSTSDKLIWPYSLDGDYQGKNAYEILTIATPLPTLAQNLEEALEN